MNFVTDFADQAVLLPLLVAGAVLLGLQRHWRLALAWVAALCGVSALVLALKIACYACGWMWPVLDAGAADVRSPSGHVAASSVLYGSLAVLVAAGSRGRAMRVAVVGAGAVAGVIGATRLGLGVHSTAEVLLGAAVGVSGALAFALMAGGRIPRSAGGPVLATSLLLAIAMHGTRLPAESAIQGRGALLLRMGLAACNPGWDQAAR